MMNKFVEPRPYADPEAAARKIVELANAVEADAADPRAWLAQPPSCGATPQAPTSGNPRDRPPTFNLRSSFFILFAS